MTLSFERRVYIVKRIARLTDKLNKINNLYACRSHSGHPEDIKVRESLKKDRASTLASLKRWEKQLGIQA
jgi:hypothetical protein